ncbi:ornithine lipid N-methyltransferase [Tautonia plasticadhaerens]|uniref:16S ribosomal RNA methyltransferase KsgA/Dim1 family protein n=1 Tax=Tautonia plasticadhaerens TaxID=2527974 RepID=A0A518GYT5_9BACT|nr:ornithine lipid N-methyltransferase [Tautonia plasticadhaerens]QDV33768.1 16S ribosomal RNA methyltransferase KsgA/Dim1 family protein [Tautonia plasticadhaerens]
MNLSLLFLGKFLRHGTAIASLAPSSPWLSRATVRNVDWDRARVLIELGAGTGPITRELVDRARPETRLIVLERDPDFVRVLRERFEPRPNLEIIEGDVRDLAAMLKDRGIDRVDNVISGLPVPSFPKDLQRDLIRNVSQILDPAGTYNQITELPWVYLRFYRSFFYEVRFAFEPRNIPPAGAYYCRGVRPID